MKKIEITCAGCGKKHEIVSEDGHTGVVKCDCGMTSGIKGDAASILKDLGPLLDKIPGILGTLKQSRRRGFDTGIDEGLHEVARELVHEVMKEDSELRESMKETVKDCLERALQGGEEDEAPPTRQ